MEKFIIFKLNKIPNSMGIVFRWLWIFLAIKNLRWAFKENKTNFTFTIRATRLRLGPRLPFSRQPRSKQDLGKEKGRPTP